MAQLGKDGLPVNLDPSFKESLRFVLKWEGAMFNGKVKEDGGLHIVNGDPGGITKYGISQKAHPKLAIKDLDIDRACKIYYNDYWKPAGCIGLGQPIATVLFDTAVNMGVGTATRLFVETKDPQIYLRKRQQTYHERINKNHHLLKFLNGWTNRINDLKKYVDVKLQEQKDGV